ncbi:hypothetical protein ACFQL1_01645 [Halomicroarcula sp. GCM10025709]|uniref:hypothetical protein n=1 Tax=Haloarcula TaxID=2237 RepID=UPI0024C452ED|nr:hypothetical protein [Halomicroarcula sp. YJ-61-S]
MTDSQFITAPCSEFSEAVLTGLGSEPDPHRDVIRALSDPYRYVHVLDQREFGGTSCR